jgi:uncharacterized protein
MSDLYFEYFLVALMGLSIGISKSGLPTIAMATIPFMMQFFPTSLFTGIYLPLLVLGDGLAFSLYKNEIQWPILKRLIPAISLGLIFGSLILKNVPDDLWLEQFIGWTLIILAIVKIFDEGQWRVRGFSGIHFGQVLTFIGSTTTTISHIGGPFIGIYLLSKQLTKRQFLGTYAAIFFVINIVKVPIYLYLDLLSLRTLTYDIIGFPCVFLGSMIGKWIVPYVSQFLFNYTILILVIIAALRLVI